MQSLRHDGILVACKAAELDWDIVSAILHCRYVNGAAGSLELTPAEVQFAAVNRETAGRLMRFGRCGLRIARRVERGLPVRLGPLGFADSVRASSLEPALECAIDVKCAFGENQHDAHAALSRILLEQNRYGRLRYQSPRNSYRLASID